LPFNRYFFIDIPRTIASRERFSHHHRQQKRLNRLNQSSFCIFPYLGQNGLPLTNLSRGLPRSILGHLKPFKHIPRKKAVFRYLLAIFDFVILSEYFFVKDYHKEKSYLKDSFYFLLITILLLMLMM
jgi:hypothetical protein